MNRRTLWFTVIFFFTLTLAGGYFWSPPGAFWRFAPWADRGEPPRFVETGDLPEIKERGRLRVLAPKAAELPYLPRGRGWEGREAALIDGLGPFLGLEVTPVPVARRGEMIPALLAGKGDLIAEGFAVTPDREARVAFSVPLASVTERIVLPSDAPKIESPADLAGRPVAVRRSSVYAQSLEALREEYPEIEIQFVAEDMDTLTLLDGVASGRYAATVADASALEAFLAYGGGVRPSLVLHTERRVAWAMRPNAEGLLSEVNRYLQQSPAAIHRARRHRDDLDGIRERGVLRVLTRNNAVTYFIWRGRLMGFEYELAREFARQRELRLEMVVPPSRADLFPWLKAGRGDLVAASLTATPGREAREAVRFSRPYHSVSEVVVAPGDAPPMESAADLDGRRVHVRPSSSYQLTLEAIRESGVDVEIVPAPEELETEDIIHRVATGEYDLTVADSHILEVEQAWREDIRGVLTLGEPVVHGWAVRPENEALLKAVNDFFDAEYRGLIYNMTRNRYLEDAEIMENHARFRSKRRGALSPWDGMARKYAERHDFDWRLIVAQMYEESRFDPEARSFAGAVGLMQLLPRTARSVGVTDLTDPEENIRAGVTYLAAQREFFEPELPVGERLLFMLAAYNAGRGHVRDARDLAERLGRSPDRWDDHVSHAMGLLSESRYARRARYGYVRGRETIRYVRKIRDRYRAYLAAAEGAAPPAAE